MIQRSLKLHTWTVSILKAVSVLASNFNLTPLPDRDMEKSPVAQDRPFTVNLECIRFTCRGDGEISSCSIGTKFYL